MGDFDVSNFLEALKQLIPKVKSSKRRRRVLRSLEEEITYMREFLKATEKKRYEHSEVLSMVKQINDLVFEAESIVQLFVVRANRALNANQDNPSLPLGSVIKKIQTLTAEINQIYNENVYDINGLAGKKFNHSVSENEGGSSSLGESNTSELGVVGFEEEVKSLLGMLRYDGDGGQLEIIAIIGAGGSGKTTLVRQMYQHRWTKATFVRAWVTVSQDYDNTMKRNLLIPILKSISLTESGDYEKSSDDDLGEETLKCLKGKKYLIVMDDMGGIEAWNDIQRSFPRERNGSKVLFTSQMPTEPNNISYLPHRLDPLTKSYSWELLQKKVFGKNHCPSELDHIGKHIVEKCEGLPLAIVAVAGILVEEDKTPVVWKEVDKNLSSIIAEKSNNCMKILELSYNHLPLHLKACFLYIGGFLEDSEIPVRELIWLWIAEGFIQESEGDKSLEDIARDYLQNLIDRSLVIEARKRSYGGIKACHIHDLLRKLCLIKAEEDNFLVQIYRSRNFSPSVAIKHRRLFIDSKFLPEFSSSPCAQNLRSFMCLRLKESASLSFDDLSFFVKNFELLRVLHLISVGFQVLGGGHLVHLRYLALDLPHDISEFLWSSLYLFNLETLYIRIMIKARSYQPFGMHKTIPLPPNILKMVKLRHLYAKSGAFEYHHNVAVGIDFGCSSKLDSLQTLHSICPCEKCLKFLIRTPNLRKLGIWGNLRDTRCREIFPTRSLKFPDLEFLNRLETLSFRHIGQDHLDINIILGSVLKFPPTVTRLTLMNTGLEWKALSVLQTLPSLEVLKLLVWSCFGKIWDTSELEFSHLKYLKMERVCLVEWNASDDQFPRLEVLVVRQCINLERIPSDFAKLNDLREIDVRECRSSGVRQSAMEIKEARKNESDGNINLLT